MNRDVGIMLGLLGVFIIAPFVGAYPVLWMKILCFALFACAFNLLLGYAGLLSFGHAAFFGGSAYITGYLCRDLGWSTEIGIVAGTMFSVVLGYVFGSLAIRRAGIYFAMITLALAQMMYFVWLQLKALGGEDGLQGIPRGKFLGFLDLSNDLNLYYAVLAICAAGFWIIYRAIHSPFGQVLKAIRENEPRAISLGYDVARFKLMAFVLSAGIAGLAGSTKSLVLQLASLTDVHWHMSGEVVLMTLLGGMGTVFGPIVGAGVVVLLQNAAVFGKWTLVAQGAIFAVCVLMFRRGIVGELARLVGKPMKFKLELEIKPAEPQKTANVAMVNSMTGPRALYGLAGIEGARIAVEELNASGGLLGRRLNLIVRDDTGDPAVAAREARQVIVHDGAALLLGPVGSDVLLAMSEVAKERKAILISQTASTERAFVERGHRYIFSVVTNTFIEGSAMGLYMAKKPYRRYMILGPDYEFGHIQAEAFERRLVEKKKDVEIVGRLWSKPGEVDFTPFITAIIAAKPDAVYSNLFGWDLATFTRQARAHKFFESFAFAAMYDVDTLQALGKDAVEGVIAYDRGPFHVIRTLAPSERFEDFIRKYGAATNKYPSAWAINSYDAVKTWAKAVAKANTFDTEQVVEALEEIELDSLRGPGHFIRKVDHQANVGCYIGVVAWDPRFHDFAIWKDATYIPGDQVWRSEAEVLEVRNKAGR